MKALTFLSSVEAQCSESGIALAGSSGSFCSQDYPSNYPNDLTCTWIITVPQGHVVLRDGTVESSKLLGRYCGKQLPAAVQSSGRSMWVQFYASPSNNEKGFFATYKAVERPRVVEEATHYSDILDEKINNSSLPCAKITHTGVTKVNGNNTLPTLPSISWYQSVGPSSTLPPPQRSKVSTRQQ
ncbi:hypothetical protein ACROYT_G025874 [Oculina patagonica]